MPRATIIHNVTAGNGRATADRLVELVRRQGYHPGYATTDDDLDAALLDPGELVVAAGGDGTVAKVAVRLAGRDTPIAILPLGTANNVATGLGIAGRPPEALAAGWSAGRRRRVDVGYARGPWGVLRFVESFGLGVFAHAMPILAVLGDADGGPTDVEERLEYDRRGLRALLRDFRPRPLSLVLDGEPADGSYLMVEALNGPLLGPGLRLAPDADWGDGRLDVVLVRTDDRSALASRLLAGGAEPVEAAALEVRRVASMRFRWTGEALHIDGRPWGDTSAPLGKTRTVHRPEDAEVEVGLEPVGVEVLVPGE